MAERFGRVRSDRGRSIGCPRVAEKYPPDCSAAGAGIVPRGSAQPCDSAETVTTVRVQPVRRPHTAAMTKHIPVAVLLTISCSGISQAGDKIRYQEIPN